MRSGKAARMELMKKLEKWKKNVGKRQKILKSVNCVNNCGYGENNCPVPMRFCNCCINKDKCNCMNKKIDNHLKFTMG